jgi:hypothetical protein
LEVVEGADAGDVFGVEAADEGIEGSSRIIWTQTSKLVTLHSSMARQERNIRTGWRAMRPWSVEYSEAKMG